MLLSRPRALPARLRAMMPLARAYLVGRTLDKAKPCELTIYVKGFLSPGESEDDFEEWFACHRVLTRTHGWGGARAGYAWDSGAVYSIGSVPVPLATLAAASLLALRSVRALASPISLVPVLAAVGLSEAALLAGRLLAQYQAAQTTAAERASDLANVLRDARKSQQRVRLVCHSLGAAHAVRGLALLPGDERPDEVHLCAPACTEADLAPLLGAHADSGVARGQAFLYYSAQDAVLASLFRLLARGEHALGAAPPKQTHARLSCIDVSDYFGLSVHSAYREMFAHFAGRPRGALPGAPVEPVGWTRGKDDSSLSTPQG